VGERDNDSCPAPFYLAAYVAVSPKLNSANFNDRSAIRSFVLLKVARQSFRPR
jgi:hypothetical protein